MYMYVAKRYRPNSIMSQIAYVIQKLCTRFQPFALQWDVNQPSAINTNSLDIIHLPVSNKKSEHGFVCRLTQLAFISTQLYKAFSFVDGVILANQVWRYNCFHRKQL